MPDYVRREQRDDQAAEWFAYMRSQIAEGAAHLAEEARCRAADPDHQP
jgi:ferric-dicitrate binding protein FerR (iron transport regulator)